MARGKGYSNAYSRSFGLRPVPFYRRPGKQSQALSARPRMGMRVRRPARASVATRRKRRPAGRATKTGENSSMSYTKFGTKWRRNLRTLYKSVQGCQIRTDRGASSSVAAIGLQGTIEHFDCGRGDLEALSTVVNGGTATENNVKLFIGHVKRKSIYRNASNNVTKLTLYDLTLKRDPFGTAVDSPVECWNKGMLDFPGGSANLSTRIGTTPLTSPEFKRTFRVRRVTVINLEPGQQHEHTVVYRMNRVVPAVEFQNTSVFYFRNLSAFTLAVFNGGLVHDPVLQDSTAVNFGKAVIDHAFMREIHWGYMTQSAPNWVDAGGVFGTITGAGAFMGESGDNEMAVAS